MFFFIITCFFSTWIRNTNNLVDGSLMAPMKTCFLHKGCHARRIVQVAEKLPPLARADVQGFVKNETNTHLFLGYIQYTSLLSTTQGICCDHYGVLWLYLFQQQCELQSHWTASEEIQHRDEVQWWNSPQFPDHQDPEQIKTNKKCPIQSACSSEVS